MAATQKAHISVNRDGEEGGAIFASPLSAEVVKGWSSRKLPANFHPAGFCARLSSPLLTSSTRLHVPSPCTRQELLERRDYTVLPVCH